MIIRPEPARAEARVLEPTLWLTYPFAREWFDDALHEARTGHDHHSRRREIVFAVCFAEAYLVEWVWKEILNYDLDRFAKHIRREERLGLTRLWRATLHRLLCDKLIPAMPELEGDHGKEWKLLLDYRNGLVHSLASSPHKAKGKRPVSKTELDDLCAGWALRVVIDRVRRLHEAVNTPVPEWLVDP